MFTEQFVHGEHVNPVRLKHCPQSSITLNVSFIGWVLEIVGLYVFPDSLDDLGT